MISPTNHWKMFRVLVLSPVVGLVLFSLMFCPSDSERVTRQSASKEAEAVARLSALISSVTMRPTELLFVLDATQSVRAKRFQQVIKPFVRDVASLFPLASNQTRPAVVSFASCSKVRTGLDFIGPSSSSDFSKCDFMESLKAVDFIGGQGSCLGGGMARAYEILAAARPGSQRLVVLLTDGRARGDDIPTEYAQRMREDGTTIVAFGIGKGANKKELVAIATADRMFHMAKWEDLQSLAATLKKDLPPQRPASHYVDINRCSGLCAAETGPCCDARARCVCQTESGRFECICQSGYVGDGRVGNCSSVPVIEKFCLQPVGPSEGDVVCDDEDYSIGTECLFSCNEGFVLGNNALLTCELTEDGQTMWNGSIPKCEAVPIVEHFCDVPVSTYGQVVCDDSTYSIGTTCSIVCDEGFVLANDGPIVCEITENGQVVWSRPFPECQAIPSPEQFCAIPDPLANGQVICNDQAYGIGTVCSFICNEGFVLGDNGPIICNVTADGQATWRGATPACEAVPVTEQFCIAPSAPTHGQVLCDDLEYGIGAECSFNCSEGFQLANDGPIVCQMTENGRAVWSGPTPECEDIVEHFCAPPSFPADGQVVCDDLEYGIGALCSFACNKGFILANNEPILCEFTEHGKAVWIGQTPVCEDFLPPQWLNCPNDTVAPTDHRRPSATVTWKAPQAQSKGQLTLVSTAEPPVDLRMGATEVRYMATDELGRRAECSFSVQVVDQEPPILLTCPADMTESTDSQTLQVSWDTPRFKDNSEVVSMETNSQVDSILATLDVPKEVWYQARDEAGQHAYCNFTVYLKPYECPYMEPPLHGALLCESWLDEGTVCAVSCREGYDFHRPPAALYVCSPSSGDVGTSEWQVIDVSTAAIEKSGISWPQCYKKVEGIRSSSKKSIRYFDGVCSTENTKSKLRKKFQRFFRRLEKVVPGFCSEGCEEEGVLVSCGMEEQGVDVGQDAGGDRRRRDVDKDALLGLLAENPVFSLKSNLPTNTLMSRLQGVLLNDLDDSIKDSLAPFLETLSSSADPAVPGLVCEEGHVQRASVCLECPVGTYHLPALEECVGCEPGTFQDEAGQAACKPCPVGANTTDAGARNRNQCRYPCLAGTYSRTGLQPCLACPVGTFQLTEGATSCQQCPDDAGPQIEGAASLEDCMYPCDAGSFSMSGYQPCIPCAPGWYQPMRKQHSCLPCPVGSSSEMLGATVISSCIELVVCHITPCQHNGTCVNRADNSAFCQCVDGFTGTLCETNIDECENNLCMNGGTCQDEVAGYQCNCPAGFNGTNCEVDIDECLPGPCVHALSCSDGINTYHCECLDGYNGTNCEINIDECASAPCQNGGTCQDGVGDFQCVCGPSYKGLQCEMLAIPGCNESTCLNGGMCTDLPHEPLCQCAPGYTGELCETDIDDCVGVTCLHGGSCLDEVTTYSCKCLPGYAGALCDVNLDECESDPCMNGATCVDGINSFTCNCTEGFSGLTCEESMDHCSPNPCQNGAACIHEVSDYHCQCVDGYSGKDCEVDIDDCVKAFCDNGGTCVDLVGGYWCRCAVGFTGSDCEININDCRSNPCQNGGRCVDGINDVQCLCTAGFTGERCDVDIDECVGVLCSNNGSCVDEENGFHCDCQIGFSGNLCEVNIQDCRDDACENGGTCLDGINAFDCVCPEGFTGDRCDIHIDDCAGSPCMNAGQCVDGVRGYTCSCARGFTGTHCETNIDNCIRDPCRNGGNCVDGIESFHCECIPGYTGRLCEFNIDECWSRPCMNKGRCKDAVDGYHCFCRRGFTGTNCELDVDDCEKNSCRNGATCVDGTNSYTCQCAEGYSGRYCQLKDYCLFRPCLNNGVCYSLDKGYRCKCPNNFRGQNCETLIPPCENHMCANEGTCVDKPEGPARCLCTDGYTGTHCETVVDFCVSRPCHNNGSCINEITGYLCDCPEGFGGRNCEIDIDECQSGPCHHNGTCRDLVNGYICECRPGYTGERCSVDIDDCINMPCENGGSCTDRVNSYSCDCVIGFIGNSCEINQDDCKSAPCENAAMCVGSINNYTCLCLEGFSGKDCEINIDDCMDNPCRNGGSCVDAVNDFQCQCKAGFTGKMCDMNIDDCHGIFCQNGGRCIDDVEDFFCQCMPGFTGVLCEDNIDDCEGVLCRNGGTCIDGLNEFSCQCATGFAGSVCEINIDDCREKPCQNGATCVDGVASFTCHCLPGYTGEFCAVDVDECRSNPCLNGASCVDGVDSFTCQCLPGYTSEFCAVDVDECRSNPCLNGASCVDGVDSFTCQCLQGFAGDLCGIDVDECGSNPCKNGAQCLDKLDGYLCICGEGFAGVSCETDVNECKSQPCKNGASCVDLVNSFRCDCLRGYSGSLCETDIDYCASNPCQNNGKCFDSIDSFSCVCQMGFSGPRCEVNINDCATNRCMNGGLCVDRINTFYCLCRRGFSGHLCQVNIDDCASQPCQNNGTCLDHVSSYTCTCAAGFTGKHCQTNINDCQPNYCENGGQCVDGISTYQCHCLPGFSGRHCEVLLDDCFSRPCKNGARCIDGDQDYSCKCIPGFTGKDCEVDVDECASAPCLNEGICYDDVNSFMCECPEGFTGLTCEVNLDDCASSPCLNGAECQDLPRGFSCYCQDGYRGDRCEIRIGPCEVSQCLNGGQCIPDDDGSFQCLCRHGYQGIFCEEDIDDCLEHMEECLNGAVCEDRVGGFVCRCAPGYSGDDCQLKLSLDFDLIFGPSSLPFTHPIHMQPDLRELTLSLWIRPEGMARRGPIVSYIIYNEPDQQTTLHHGTMNIVLSLRDYSNMIVQLNSEVLATNFRPVWEVDWHHVAFTWKAESGDWHFYFDGTLQRQGTGLQMGAFIPGGGLLTLGREHDGISGEQEGSLGSFVGRLSQVNIWQYAMSDSQILSLYGSCGSIGDAMAWPQTLQDGITIYRRQPSQICTRIDDCASSPCRNGATCRDLVDSFACDCTDGFEGFACHVVSASCMVGTCLNGGRCHDGPRGPVCECTPGFTGPRCEEATDPCSLLHCKNGGSCDLGEGSRPLCRCMAGFRGPVCNQDINECAVHSGGCEQTCINTHGSFHCECDAGFVLQADGKSCLDSRRCRRNGVIRQANEVWEDDCAHCRCVGGKAKCTALICFDPVCPEGQTAIREPGFCCPVCSAGQAQNKAIPTSTGGQNDLASCTVNPKGNFQTFDFHSFHFHGNCRYTMAQDCSSGSFSVHLELENKDASPQSRRRPLGKVVFVYLHGVKIELGPAGVKVDGRLVELPFAISEHAQIQVHRFHDNKIRVILREGVEVSWGPDGRVQVSVGRSFRRRLCGLCGNFNGKIEDDSLTKQQLPSHTDLEFIHSWKVNGYEHCTLPAVIPETLSLPRHLIGSLPACAGLNYHGWREVRAKCDILKQETFAECREVVDPWSFYELCQQDACSCGGNEPCYCEAIAAYAQECRRNGIIVREWSNSTICGIDCPDTMIFDDCGPPCLETCYNTANLIELCRRLPCVARCQCAAGFAFHEGQCIRKSTCPNLVDSTGG